MQPRAKKLLWDVAEASSDIARLLSALTFEDYLAQKDTRRLIERYLEIIGEALRQLGQVDPNAALLLPALRRWVNLRNVISHAYDSLDDETIWAICQSTVPQLHDDVRQLLDQ